MESPGFAVIALWFSSHQIYRLLISASPTLMDTQARSFEHEQPFILSLSITKIAHTQQGGEIQVTPVIYSFFSTGFQKLLCNI